MTQRSSIWNGTTIGDAIGVAPYDGPLEMAAVFRSLNGANANSQRSGVCRDELNELAATGVATPITIDTGRAFVYGTWYENDASTTLAVDAAVAATRTDYLVLRKDYVAQTVRLQIIKNDTEGTGLPPALTQNTTTYWDFPLYIVDMAVGGVITLTDCRQYVPYLAGSYFERLADTTLGVSSALVTFSINGLSNRLYMVVVNSKIATAMHAPETLGLYFTPTSATEYDYAAIQTYGSPPLSHSTPGVFATSYLDVGNVGESTPYTTRYPMSVIFLSNLHTSYDKAVFSLVTGLSSGLFVAVQSGTFRYANPVTAINLFIPAGDSFAVGSRFTLYGIA